MRDQIADVIAVVTGAGAGLGRALSHRLTSEGVHVIGISRSEANLAETGRGCVPGRFIAVRGDVSDFSKMEEVSRDIESLLGPVSILINNAAICIEQDFFRTAAADIADHIRINCLGPLYAAKAFIPQMLACNRGRIINVGSFAGGEPNVGKVGYSVSKAGARAFAKGLANELDAYLPAITVSEWIPGIMATKNGHPEGILPAEAALWGATLAMDFRREFHGLTFLKDKELIEPPSLRRRVRDRLLMRPQRVPYILIPDSHTGAVSIKV